MIEMGRRLIGRYSGNEKGPLMICLGGMHGNEDTGVKALELIFKMLEVEPITNLDFRFKGRLVGFNGNVKALDAGVRYFEQDLNRIWTAQIIDEVMNSDLHDLTNEKRELGELLRACHAEIDSYQPDQIIILDLHTTSCEGGIFSIVREELDSIELGIELHAPVIRGMITGLEGTTMHYFNDEHFDIPITSIVFESGQHENPLSVNRAIAAIINCMRTAKLVSAEHVENQHDKLLIEHSKNLPVVAQLIYGHRIKPGDEFVMNPGFKNFDLVKEGQELAKDRFGPICSKNDGLLLMPLYQEQGEDGFFIIEEHDPETLPLRKSAIHLAELGK